MEIKWPAHCQKCQYHDKFSTTEYCSYCCETGKSRVVEYFGKEHKSPATEHGLVKETQKLINECKHYKDERLKSEARKKDIIITTKRAINVRKTYIEEQKKSEERMELYKRGLSDVQIARRLGVDKSTIWNWRKNRNLPPNKRK